MTADPAAPGVQPHGCLITLSPGWYVTSASANLADFAGMATEDGLGRPLADLFGGDTVHALRNRLALLRDVGEEARLLRHPLGAEAHMFDFAMRLSGSGVILEIQPNPEREAPDIAGSVRASVKRLSKLTESNALLNEAARQCRAMTGFDSVTIYRTCTDANSAEIVAESNRGAMAGAPCPGTARRLVADREAKSVPLLPAAATLPKTPLRAPSNAERQQMMESGAQALLTVPITVAEEPWGLIACRHERQRVVSLERLGAVELFADIVGMRIAMTGSSRS